MSASLVGAAMAGESAASADTWTIDTTMYGTKPIHSRCMILLETQADTIVARGCRTP
jgi:hypothetical protein